MKQGNGGVYLMEQKEKMSLVEYTDIYGKICENTDLISAELFDEYGVKRGLRDKNGNGVLSGLTHISKIEAFKNVKTNKKLVIAGGSSDTDSFTKELKNLAKGDDRIIFTGFVQGQILGELYSNAYMYTLPSDLEGMPLSLLEAMSYGNCCLVSDIPECTEVVEDKALIFKKSDVAGLKEKLQEACDHPEKVIELKKQAADFICEKYNWDDVVEETMKLYRRK